MVFFQDEQPARDLDDDLDDDWSEDSDIEHISFVCEDCDYRWEEASEGEVDSDTIVCPMCGSLNVTQL